MPEVAPDNKPTGPFEGQVLYMLGAIQADGRHTLNELTSIKRELQDHAKRLSAVERFQAKVVAVASVISATVATAITALIKTLFS